MSKILYLLEVRRRTIDLDMLKEFLAYLIDNGKDEDGNLNIVREFDRFMEE